MLTLNKLRDKPAKIKIARYMDMLKKAHGTPAQARIAVIKWMSDDAGAIFMGTRGIIDRWIFEYLHKSDLLYMKKKGLTRDWWKKRK